MNPIGETVTFVTIIGGTELGNPLDGMVAARFTTSSTTSLVGWPCRRTLSLLSPAHHRRTPAGRRGPTRRWRPASLVCSAPWGRRLVRKEAPADLAAASLLRACARALATPGIGWDGV